jgi:hypothetical protein
MFLRPKQKIRMKKVTLKLASVLLLVGATLSSNAQKINVVTSAVPFLRVTPDARQGAMGDVGIATSVDANSAFNNFAKTAFSEKKGAIAFNYVPWLRDLAVNDIYLMSGSGYYKLNDQEAVGASLRYFNLGNIQFTDFQGVDLTSYRPREFAVDVAYSRKLTNKNSLGIALRYINSNLASGAVNGVNYKTGTAVAGDITFYHNGAKENGEGFSWGATLTNLGSKIGYTSDATQKDYIPANIGIGGAYTKVFDEESKLTFAADINKLLVPTPKDTSAAALADYRSQGVVGSWLKSFGDAPDGFSEEVKEFNLAIGAEYWYKDQFAFRAGYHYESPLKGNRKFFTVGAGLKYNTVTLNFAYLFNSGQGINRNPLSNTYRFGVAFDFGGTTASK